MDHPAKQLAVDMIQAGNKMQRTIIEAQREYVTDTVMANREYARRMKEWDTFIKERISTDLSGAFKL